jgi:hypothetical protein
MFHMKKNALRFSVFLLMLGFSSKVFAGNKTIEKFLPDTVLTDTNKLWYDKINFMLIGVGADRRDFNIDFKSNTANLIGFLQFTHLANDRGLSLQDWNFAPTINQNNASVFLNTKYGSIGFSKAIKPVDRENYTKTTFFNFSLPFKNWTFSFEYLDFLGLDRTEPVYRTNTFLKDMRYNSMSVGVEYRVERLGGKLKNSLFYVPKKPMGSSSLVLGYMKMAIDNPTDFIPGLMFKNNHADDSIVMVNGVFMDRFTSSGFFFGGPKVDFVVPIVKGKNMFKPKVFYLKGSVYYGLNSQKFEYHKITDTVKVLYASTNKLKGFGVTTNYYFKASLVYDFNIGLMGIGGVFFSQKYGDGDSGIDNRMVERRLNFNAFLSFRIGAKRAYGKIDTFKKGIFNRPN